MIKVLETKAFSSTVFTAGKILSRARKAAVKPGSSGSPGGGGNGILSFLRWPRGHASSIRHMLLGGYDQKPRDSEGVFLSRAYVISQLNLDRRKLPGAMFLNQCRFVEDILMRQTALMELSFEDCTINGSMVQHARI